MSYDPDPNESERPHYDPDSYEEGGYPFVGESWHPTYAESDPTAEQNPEPSVSDPYEDTRNFPDPIAEVIDSIGEFLKDPLGKLFGDW